VRSTCEVEEVELEMAFGFPSVPTIIKYPLNQVKNFFFPKKKKKKKKKKQFYICFQKKKKKKKNYLQKQNMLHDPQGHKSKQPFINCNKLGVIFF